jgi:NTP pyrophosphatase (non-canonical NTP hydrolase)
VTQADAIAQVLAERERQARLWNQYHKWGWGDCSSNLIAPVTKVAVLTEECGEVARAVLDGDPANLRTELVQVAAVALAWLESLGDAE